MEIKDIKKIFKLMKQFGINELHIESMVIKMHNIETMQSSASHKRKIPTSSTKKFDLDKYVAEQEVTKSLDEIIDNDPDFDLFQRGQLNFNKD